MMCTWVLMRYFQFIESCNSVGILPAFKKLILWKREIIPVVKELGTLKRIDNKGFKRWELYEITKDNYEQDRYLHSIKSRKYKMKKYLNDGCKAFVVTNGNEIAGDVWYTTAKISNNNFHDLKWLNLCLKENEAYMFDMFVSPEQREHHVNDFLVNRSLIALKQKGFKRIYGYYDSDNIPALWFHRKHRYTELKKLNVKQTLLTKRVC